MAMVPDKADRLYSPRLTVGALDGTQFWLLPYQEQRGESRLSQFQHAEPWDTPRVRVQQLDIAGLLAPFETLQSEPTGTDYPPLIDGGTAWGERIPAGWCSRPYLRANRWPAPIDWGAIFDPGFRLEDLRDSGHPIILPVEAAERMLWTRPADLDY
jgi:hypothetical protein